MRIVVATAVVHALLLAGCSSATGVTPQPCDQQLTTASFRVCLPADAGLVLSGEHEAAATVGDVQVNLLESSAAPGDPDQAAHAVLAALQDGIGQSVAGATSTDPLALGEEGAIEVAGTDGAFQSLEAVYDTGDVDHVVTWGRAIVVDGRAAAVVVTRRWDTDAEVSSEQVDTARASALPLVLTLAPGDPVA